MVVIVDREAATLELGFDLLLHGEDLGLRCRGTVGRREGGSEEEMAGKMRRVGIIYLFYAKDDAAKSASRRVDWVKGRSNSDDRVGMGFDCGLTQTRLVLWLEFGFTGDGR